MAWLKGLHPVAVIKQLKQTIASIRQQRRQARRENEGLRKENERLHQQLERERKERDRRQQENERLKRQLEPALRAQKRQAALFSRGTRQPNPQRPGRKPGQAYGKHRRKTIPEQVDQVIPVPVPTQCPDPQCGGALQVERTESQFQQPAIY